MIALQPTRISIYDFLIEDTQPIAPIVADIGQVSIPQAKIIIVRGIQALVSAILAYNQKQGSHAFIKNLLNRSHVKELRKYNAFNSNAMVVAWTGGQPVSDTLFRNARVQKEVCHHLAVDSELPIEKVQPILSALVLLCLRELAILVDYAHLDADEVHTWLELQNQFLTDRNPSTQHDSQVFKHSSSASEPSVDNTLNNDDTVRQSQVITDDGQEMSNIQTPLFDPMWYEIVGYSDVPKPITTSEEYLPHYAKVIGRIPVKTTNQSGETGSSGVIVDTSNDSDVLTFSKMEGISLPYQRWLLQLAKISDIYLSRVRLKIASEPQQAPSKPFVNFQFIEENLNKLDRGSSNEPTSQVPFYKNIVIILVFIVIGVLTIIAIAKAQLKKPQSAHFDTVPSMQQPFEG